MVKKPGVQYDNYQMTGGNQMTSGNKQVLSHQVLAKQGGQVGTNFSNQVKAGLSGVGGPSNQGGAQFGGAFGPSKQNLYHNQPTAQQ